ncbi:MAG: hypothetical protein B7Y39_17075 [Bdellovibrio sp. 28-41-41]|nr:MAG: hypothetical protein B7Y39_17075 [Bdellovibrio sp. 28-41-41]
MGYIKGLFALSVSAVLLTSCGKGFESIEESTTVGVPILQKVTKETYMSGHKFCDMYTNTNNSRTVKIYTYLKREFDPKLPSYIFVDGGPGQNTHAYPDILGSGFNEIHFDQRGVGCSAPDTWEEYTDQELYSSFKTANDIDEVRKAYDVKSVSIYAVSYGTLPATIYANKFEANVKSIVLEGVLGTVETLSRYSHRVEKYNLILNSLTEKQRDAFDDVVYGNSNKQKYVLMYLLGTAGFRDGGYYFKKLLPESGGINASEFDRAYGNIMKEQNPYNTAQHPGATDENVLTRFYCKELGGFSKDKFTMNYNRTRGFVEEPTVDKTTWAEECAAQGITLAMENTYDERKYPTNATVYYFQGSHDGATIASGALSHWKTVPQKKSFFMLSKKGGHNPGLTKANAKDKEISKIHKQLFSDAFSNKRITVDFVKQLNAKITSTTVEEDKTQSFITWELFSGTKTDFSAVENEFGGLRRWKQ